MRWAQIEVDLVEIEDALDELIESIDNHSWNEAHRQARLLALLVAGLQKLLP